MLCFNKTKLFVFISNKTKFEYGLDWKHIYKIHKSEINCCSSFEHEALVALNSTV